MQNYGKLGFGFLRLPQKNNGEIDLDTTQKMVDLFLQRGFRYFDTAYTYMNGENEEYLRQALVERYPRDAYMIADKLPCGYLKDGRTAEDIFSEQLRRCGVDYFDVYLLHGLDDEDAEMTEKMGCFIFLKELKKRGLVRQIGFSFHDRAEVLDRILTRHPEIDLVQIQLNYLDWENPIIQSGACWEVCRKHGKPIVVMEPVKGGTLASIPEQAAKLLNGEPPAHRALRFAATREGVALVLSGMSSLEQVSENTALMAPLVPLTGPETDVLYEAAQIIRENVAIACTGCGYCVAGCPAGIPIPRYFALFNERARDGWQADTESRYATLTRQLPCASSCISCGRCEASCPQKLPVQRLLKDVTLAYGK